MNPLFRFLKPRRLVNADIRDVSDLDTPLGREVLAIYEQAFPEVERDPVENIAASLKNPDPDTDMTRLRALAEENRVVGFTYFSTYKDYYLGFLKFIAVRQDIRGKGYGPLLLQDAIQQVRADGRRATGWPYLGLVLEVERPETAENDQDRQLRERRIQFYRRNGAVMIEGTDLYCAAGRARPASAAVSFDGFARRPQIWNAALAAKKRRQGAADGRLWRRPGQLVCAPCAGSPPLSPAARALTVITTAAVRKTLPHRDEQGAKSPLLTIVCWMSESPGVACAPDC